MDFTRKLCLFAVPLLAACSGDSTSPRDRVAVTISTSAPVYARGSQVKAVVKNTGTRTVLVNPCFLDLQVREPTGWRTVLARGCFDFALRDFVVLAPGAALPDSMATAGSLPSGQYRLLFDVRLERNAPSISPDLQRAASVSNSFSIH